MLFELCLFPILVLKCGVQAYYRVGVSSANELLH